MVKYFFNLTLCAYKVIMSLTEFYDQIQKNYFNYESWKTISSH